MSAPEKRLRLLRVTTQAVFVVEQDGELLEMFSAEPVTVPSADWPGYATGGFEEMRRNTEATLNRPEKPRRWWRRTPKEQA